MNQQQIRQLLLSTLPPLEQERRNIHKRIQQYNFWSGMALGAGIIFVLTSILLTNLFFGGAGASFSAFFVSGAFVILGVYLYKEHAAIEGQFLRNSLEEQIKTEVYTPIFKAWNTSIQYLPKEQVKREYFQLAALHEGYDNYKGEDFCEGVLKDGRKFQFSEVWAQREVYSSSSEQDYPSNSATVFRGLFFILENTLPYADFDGFLKIYPSLVEAPSVVDEPSLLPQKKSDKKHYENILDADFLPVAPSSKKSSSKEALSSLFDRMYTVEEAEGEDELATTQLPLALTEQLGHLRSFFQQQFSITFYNQKAYFSTRLPFDYLPVSVESSLISEARIQHLVNNFWITFLVLEKIAEATVVTPSRKL